MTSLTCCILLPLVAAVGLSGCKASREPPTSAPAQDAKTLVRSLRVDPSLIDAGRFRTAPVAKRVPSGFMTLPADVVASAEGAAEAGTPVAGRVTRFEAREGDRVKRGQVLAWLDSPEAAKAAAEVMRARARSETQARKVARIESLVRAEATSPLAIDEARLELELARADLAAARTVATSFGLSQDSVAANVPIRSPVDGVVVMRAAALGAHVTPEASLFRLVSEGRVLVDARIADGMPLPALGTMADAAPRGGSPCRARVLAVLPQVDRETRTRTVRFAPEPACKGLVPGAQADVSVALGQESAVEALVVPASATLDVRSAPFAFVALAGDAFEARPVELGPRIGDDVIVRAGLSEGEPVVVEGAVLLKGELIRSELGGAEP